MDWLWQLMFMASIFWWARPDRKYDLILTVDLTFKPKEHRLVASEPFWIPLSLYLSMYYLTGRVWYGKKMYSLQKTLHHV